MLLSYLELKSEVQDRVVLNCLDDNVNGSSIDVRIGGKLLVETRPASFKADEMPVVSLREREPLNFDEVELVEGGDPFLLYPGQFILAHTIEQFNIPLTLTAEFRLNSSGARMGLNHNLAVWCDPGWNNSALTLELHNVTQHHVVALHYGDRIGQVVFHRHAAVPRNRSYAARGAYNHDEAASAARPAKE